LDYSNKRTFKRIQFEALSINKMKIRIEALKEVERSAQDERYIQSELSTPLRAPRFTS